MSTSQCPVIMYLNLFVWKDGEVPPAGADSSKAQKTYFEDSVYLYQYQYADGTLLMHPVIVAAETKISIEVKSSNTKKPAEVFSCMVNDMQTGAIVYMKMAHAPGRTDPVQIALTEVNRQHDIQVEEIGDDNKPIVIIGKPRVRGTYKITLFAEYDGVIVPCDPQVTDEGDEP